VSTNPASIEIVTDAAGDEGPLLPIERGVVRCASVFMIRREDEPAEDSLSVAELHTSGGPSEDAAGSDVEAAAARASLSLVADPASEAARPALVRALGSQSPVRAAKPVPSAGAAQSSAHRPASARSHTKAPVLGEVDAAPEFDEDHDGKTISVEQFLGLGLGTPASIVPNLPTLKPVLAGVLQLSSGGEVLLDRGAIIGRKPSVGNFTAATKPHLVTVPSPQQDISRSHVEVRCEGATVFAVDLGTTNGTRLLRAGQAAARLTTEDPTILVHGDVLDLGDEVLVTFVEAL